MNNEKGAGRKPKYPYDLLLRKLNEYLCKYPNRAISLSHLEKETQIPRHIWKDNKKIKKVIEQLNDTPIISNSSKLSFTLPNAEQFIEAHYSNKRQLIRATHEIFGLINELYDRAIIGLNVNERENVLKEQIDELKAQINKKNDEIDNLNKEIDLLYLESESPTKRKMKGLKCNLITLDQQNLSSISKKISEISKEYESLFK